MAVAPEAIEAAQAAEGAQEAGAWRAASAASARARQAPAAARRAYGSVATPSSAARTVTRLIWAIVVGLVVLEIASEATGQRWSFNLPAIGRGPAAKSPYVPLYTGQSTPAAAAMPSVFGGIVPTPAPLSNRSAGNQALG